MKDEISQEILQRLTRVETKLDMIASAKETSMEALQLAKEAHKKIDKLERIVFWASTTIIGGGFLSFLTLFAKGVE